MSDTAGHLGIGPDTGTHWREGRGHGLSVASRRLWDRQLHRYPNSVHRYVSLAIAVVAAVAIYYELYVQAAVTHSVLVHFGMTWPFFVYILVVSNLVGAVSSLFAGVADRWGRANLVTYGLLIGALITLIGLPYAPNLWLYGVFYAVLGFVEGVILVATPALVRDFSPQLERASAMGFWALGPVIASLAISLIASHTLNHLHAWQDQFIIAGIVGLVVFTIALVGLRELTPGLRGQLMVSRRDRPLVEARAGHVDIDESLKHPWRQMLKLDIVVASLGIGVFLIIFYTLIAFLAVFMASVFGYTQLRANLLGNWIWAFNVGALVVVGLLSDRLRVRKPFMLIGTVVAMVATGLFAVSTTHAHTGYYSFVWMLSLLALGIGLVLSPWLASFTETVEAHNPALVATGLAVWGWILRLIIAVSLLILPNTITTMTPIVEHGTEVQTLAAKYAPEVATVSVIDPATLARLNANPADSEAVAAAVGEISRKANVTPAAALQRLLAVSQVPRTDLAYLITYGPKVQNAIDAAPGEWQRLWWVCFGLEALLIPTLFLMKGRWSPRAARREDEAHQQRVDDELASLRETAT